MRKKSGFTIIELTMVLVIVGILASLALVQFIDLRNTFRAGAVRNALNTLRIAMKNQAQQAVLKCGITSPNTWVSAGGTSFFTNLGTNAYYGNDITFYATDPTYRVCTTSQVPNVADRTYWTLTEGERAHRYNAGADLNGTYKALKNVLVNTATGSIFPMLFHPNSDFVTLGGACGVVAYNASGGVYSHWLFNYDTGEVYAGTNTAGIAECNF